MAIYSYSDNSYSGAFAAGVLALGLVISGAATGESSAAPASPGSSDLMAMVPTPAGTTSSYGPDPIADNGIHRRFEVSGAPVDVMNAYKATLEGSGWAVSTLTSHGGGGGGGATLTGTQGDVFGVFEGGGYQSTTWVEVCTWPTKPANPNCGH